MQLFQQEPGDGENTGDNHDQGSGEEVEFVHASIMRRRGGNSDPQLPPLPSLPQRDLCCLNRSHFLLLDPGLDLFAFGPPALADLEAGKALFASRLVPLIEPKGNGANRESQQLSNLLSREVGAGAYRHHDHLSGGSMPAQCLEKCHVSHGATSPHCANTFPRVSTRLDSPAFLADSPTEESCLPTLYGEPRQLPSGSHRLGSHSLSLW